MKYISSRESSNLMVDKAINAIMNHGVILIPTHVGYTMITDLSKEGVEKIRTITRNFKDEPCRVVVSDESYKQIFDCRPLNLGSVGHITADLSLSFVRRHSKTIKKDLLHKLSEVDAINLNGECELSINFGPICDEILCGLESKNRYGILMGVHCIGIPYTKHYHLDNINPIYKLHADVIIDVPHWTKPQLDELGRWLSSPVFDLKELRFCRAGKNLSIAAVFVSVYVLTLFTQIHSGMSASISWKEFQSYYSTFENMCQDRKTDMKLHGVFKTIDKDCSGSLDVNEVYEYVLNSAHGSNAVVFGGDSSTVLMLAPPPHKKDDVKFHLETDLMPTPIKVEQPFESISMKKEDKNLEKTVFRHRARSPSPENFKRVFDDLYEQSLSRQEEGKARRHVAECLSRKRSAQRKGEKYVCDQFYYHTLSQSDDLPYANVTSTEAEELHKRWMMYKKWANSSSFELTRKMPNIRVAHTTELHTHHSKKTIDRDVSVPYDFGNIGSQMAVTKTISTSLSSLSDDVLRIKI